MPCKRACFVRQKGLFYHAKEPVLKDIIKIRNLNFSYPNGAGKLENVNLKIGAGDILTILGRNGAGKSTTLGLISGSLKPVSGEIFLDGKNVDSLSNKERAKIMAYVAQSEVTEYDYTGLEFITMGRAAHLGIFARPSKEDEEIARIYTKKLEIEYLEDRFITQMSGGQKQMCMIARAMAAQPKMIIFDEPTSALDFGNQYKFLRTVKWLKELGYSVVLTTHNPDFAVLLGGYVALVKGDGEVGFGTVDEIIRSENLSKLYGLNLNVSYIDEVKRNCCLTYPL